LNKLCLRSTGYRTSSKQWDTDLASQLNSLPTDMTRMSLVPQIITTEQKKKKKKKKKKDKSPLVVFIICEKFAQPGYEILSLST